MQSTLPSTSNDVTETGKGISGFNHTWMVCKVKMLLLWSVSSHNSRASAKGDSRGPQLRIWSMPTPEQDAKQKRVSSPISLTDCHLFLLLMMVVSFPSVSCHMTAGRSVMPLTIALENNKTHSDKHTQSTHIQNWKSLHSSCLQTAQ